ncbi:MAG: protein kinase [Myxococcota bacterium]
MSEDDPIEPQGPTQSATDALGRRSAGSTEDVLDPQVQAPPPLGLDERPKQLGDYMLERPLGAGGMGEVFVARRGDQRVALKTLQRTSSTNLLRFKHEFRALADVRHFNLIELHALGEANGRSFFTMELLEDAVPLVQWVRRGVSAGERPDLGRLEQALGSLLDGLGEIHHHGYVHRDLKPSNVLVTAAGRVVILDFGLISAVDRERALTRDGQILGTPSYMAPEQAMGLPAGPPADMYAVGVMLYECLTGRLPIEGAAMEVLAEKLATFDAEAALATSPLRWRERCVWMLRHRPEDRPSAAGLLAGLQHARRHGGRRHATSFVGREADLRLLRATRVALDEGGGPQVVHVRGPSGQGKSVLLERCTAEWIDEGDLVLHGRCREQEAIPYKGVDAIVDALALHLRRLPDADRAAVRPRSVAALARMFPVLDELWPDAKPERLDPTQLRGVAWAALREVLGGLTKQGPVVLVIDDAQWSDLDSVRLLEALLGGPQPLVVLLVLALRDDLGETQAPRAIAKSLVIGPSVARVLELGPLSEDDARRLVTELAEPGRLPPEPGRAALWADSVVLRAQGNPLFIAQLVLGLHDRDHSVDQLDQLVERRLARLDPVAHRLLAVIAVAGGPLAEALASTLIPQVDVATLQYLQEQGLIVGHLGGRGDARVETAHDRVREVMLTSLEPTMRAGLHTALGEALLSHDGEGDALFRAVDQLDAGLLDADHAQLDDERRLRLAELNRRAGTQALEAAAWVPASRYFGVAVRLIEPWIPHARTGGDRHRLCVDVMFGEARARYMNEDERWLDRTDELLRWSLSDRDHGRILNLQLEGLNQRGRFAEAMQRGITGLGRLGVRVPSSPSKLRAFLAILRGVWATRRLDRAALLAMPEAASERMRAALDIRAQVMAPAFNTKPSLGLWLMGHHAVMAMRHGYRGRTLLGLAGFGLFIIAMFDLARAMKVYDACMAVAEQRGVTAKDLVDVRSLAQFMLEPRIRPLRQAAATLEGLHGRSVEFGDPRRTEHVASLSLTIMMDAGHHHLPMLVKIGERWRQESKVSDRSGFAQLTDFVVRCYEVLIHGPAEYGFPKCDDLASGAVRDQGAFREMMVMIYFGDYARVLSLYADVERVFSRMSLKTYLTTLVALFGSIATAECLPSASALERYGMHRRLRRHRRILRGWAANVPENYAPMLDVVEAEYACLGDRFDRATLHYERAIEAAAQSGMVWLAGLAAERLASQAERHGHTLVRQAALERARGCYETWGATALVHRIDSLCTSTPLGRARAAACARGTC